MLGKNDKGKRVNFILEDPYQGTTEAQDRAYADLERLSCNSMKDIMDYMNDFKTLAAQSGRIFFPDVSQKLFRKMPADIGREIEAAWEEKFPNAQSAVIPRIHFTRNYLAEMCKKAKIQRSLKDLSFCNIDVELLALKTSK